MCLFLKNIFEGFSERVNKTPISPSELIFTPSGTYDLEST